MEASIFTQFIPSGLTVDSPKEGIFIELTLSYWPGDIESLVTIALPLSESGKNDVEFFMFIINETLK